MKRFYSQFRIMLMTFALGLTSVFMSNASLRFSDELSVNLPKVQSESTIVVFPTTGESIGPLGAGCGGREVEVKNQVKKKRRK